MVQLNVTLEADSMAKIPRTVPVSDLRQHAARVVNDARKSTKPLVITERGRATSVLMSLEAYERSEVEREILMLLARGDMEIASGTGHTLDRVLAEADSLFSENRS
jgi:prevent-host-death family protein